MLYEFAIEPAVLYEAALTRRDYRDFIRQFEIGEPNVISDYPRFNKFKSQVLRGCTEELSDNAMSRLEDLVAFIRDALRVKRSAAYDGTHDWIDNVRVEEARAHFDHVVTTSPYAKLSCLTIGQLFDGIGAYKKGIPVKRVAEEMAAAISNMLRLSSRIVFVDPYFRGTPAVWTPFVKFVEAAVSDKPCDVPRIDVLYHAHAPKSPPASFLAKKFRDECPYLRERCALRFVALEEIPGREKIHNRYVLTDIGGVFFGVGLAEEDEGHQDDVVLLVEELYVLRWQQYAELSAFKVVEDIPV